MSEEKIKEEDLNNKFICTTCNYCGNRKKVVRGNFLTELILWLFFLIPGLIYSAWRITTKQYVCPNCNNNPMIPVDSPKGSKIIEENGEKIFEKSKSNEKKRKEKQNKKWYRITLIIIILTVLVTLGFAQVLIN